MTTTTYQTDRSAILTPTSDYPPPARAWTSTERIIEVLAATEPEQWVKAGPYACSSVHSLAAKWRKKVSTKAGYMFGKIEAVGRIETADTGVQVGYVWIRRTRELVLPR